MMALEGIRVLDLSRLAPGPFCSMLLGDLGADVILVEAPPEALPSGGVIGPLRVAADDEGAQRGFAFNALGRNKRSIVLNLRKEEAREAFYRLAGTADVVLEGFRPGVVKRLGVDYETLSKLNPRLVYCSLSGYGQDGPYAGMAGHDINYIAIAGALSLIGWPGEPPAIPLNIIADYAGGGLHAAYGILAALLAREKTGRGQFVDIAMTDGVMYLLAAAISHYYLTGAVPRAGETLLNGGVPHYNVYETEDGRWITLGSLEPHFYANLCRAMRREDLISHQYDSSKREEAFAYFREQFRTKTRDEWFEILRETDICVAPVYALDEALDDPHNRHRQMLIEVEHPVVGRVPQVGIGTKLSETPGKVRSPAPRPGEHTDELLSGLGYTPEETTRLRETGAAA